MTFLRQNHKRCSCDVHSARARGRIPSGSCPLSPRVVFAAGPAWCGCTPRTFAARTAEAEGPSRRSLALCATGRAMCQPRRAPPLRVLIARVQGTTRPRAPWPVSGAKAADGCPSTSDIHEPIVRGRGLSPQTHIGLIVLGRGPYLTGQPRSLCLPLRRAEALGVPVPFCRGAPSPIWDHTKKE